MSSSSSLLLRVGEKLKIRSSCHIRNFLDTDCLVLKINRFSELKMEKLFLVFTSSTFCDQKWMENFVGEENYNWKIYLGEKETPVRSVRNYNEKSF